MMPSTRQNFAGATSSFKEF